MARRLDLRFQVPGQPRPLDQPTPPLMPAILTADGLAEGKEPSPPLFTSFTSAHFQASACASRPA